MTVDHKVVAIVPTFHPPTDVVDHVDQLLAECGAVVVVDDGSGASANDVLLRLAAAGAKVVRLPSNRGIATALNAGLDVALGALAADFVLTLDQDSRVQPGGVAAMVSQALEGAHPAVGIVVPAVVAGAPIATATTEGALPTPLEPIQSGMLIPRSTFEQVGRFRDDFVIDCVDSEFFLRTKQAGLQTLICAGCSIEHALGVHTPSLPWRQGFSYHSPVRRFYITRNRLTLLREYRDREKEWFLRVLRAELVGLAVTLVFGSHRVKTLLAVIAGIQAFRRDRYGPIPAPLRARLHISAPTP